MNSALNHDEDCVAFIVIKNRSFLAEKRKSTKIVDPGVLAIPGGHKEPHESDIQSLMRELWEELEIIPTESFYICTLLHPTKKLHRIHYFLVLSWTGEIHNNEAESLHWIPLTQIEQIEVKVDTIALAECIRVYGEKIL